MARVAEWLASVAGILSVEGSSHIKAPVNCLIIIILIINKAS